MALMRQKMLIESALRAVFRHFYVILQTSGCLLQTSSASVAENQGLNTLDHSQFRRTVCLQNSLRLLYWWLSASQHVHNNNNKSQHRLQLRSWQNSQLKSTNKNYSQEPIKVLGTPRIATFGGAL